jgi:hypothetical protein
MKWLRHDNTNVYGVLSASVSLAVAVGSLKYVIFIISQIALLQMSVCCEAGVQLVASNACPRLLNCEQGIVSFGRDQELRWIFKHETMKLFLYFAMDSGGTLLVAQLVEALRYKPKGRGFDSW